MEPRGTREIVIKIIFFGYILGVRSRQYCRYAKSPGYSSFDQGEYPGDLVYRQYCLLPAPQKYQKNSYHYQIKSVRVHLIKTGTDVWLQTYHSGDVSFRITKNSSKLYSFLLYVALTLFCFTEKEKRSSKLVGSISTALSCLSLGSLLNPGRSAGSFPEQRLVIEPSKLVPFLTGKCGHMSRVKLKQLTDKSSPEGLWLKVTLGQWNIPDHKQLFFSRVRQMFNFCAATTASCFGKLYSWSWVGSIVQKVPCCLLCYEPSPSLVVKIFLQSYRATLIPSLKEEAWRNTAFARTSCR